MPIDPTPQPRATSTQGWAMLRKVMGHYVPRRMADSQRNRQAIRALTRGGR